MRGEGDAGADTSTPSATPLRLIHLFMPLPPVVFLLAAELRIDADRGARNGAPGAILRAPPAVEPLPARSRHNAASRHSPSPTMTSATDDSPLDGGCTCRAVRYRLQGRPLFVNCCHCTWCQRETGSAFAVNAMIEADRVSLLAGEPEKVVTPSASGAGQTIVRCPHCRIALWSNYAGAGESVRFVRVGTPRRAGAAAARHPHLHLDQAAVGGDARGRAGGPEFYDSKQYWPAESLERRKALRARAGR